MTLLQSIVPSSGSVTVTLYFTVSPNSKKPPLGGRVSAIVGAVLPAMMSMLVVPVLAAGVGHREPRGVVAGVV